MCGRGGLAQELGCGAVDAVLLTVVSQNFLENGPL